MNNLNIFLFLSCLIYFKLTERKESKLKLLIGALTLYLFYKVMTGYEEGVDTQRNPNKDMVESQCKGLFFPPVVVDSDDKFQRAASPICLITSSPHIDCKYLPDKTEYCKPYECTDDTQCYGSNKICTEEHMCECPCPLGKFNKKECLDGTRGVFKHCEDCCTYSPWEREMVPFEEEPLGSQGDRTMAFFNYVYFFFFSAWIIIALWVGARPDGARKSWWKMLYLFIFPACLLLSLLLYYIIHADKNIIDLFLQDTFPGILWIFLGVILFILRMFANDLINNGSHGVLIPLIIVAAIYNPIIFSHIWSVYMDTNNNVTDDKRCKK